MNNVMNPNNADRFPVPDAVLPGNPSETGTSPAARIDGKAERMPTKEIVGKSPLQPQASSTPQLMADAQTQAQQGSVPAASAPQTLPALPSAEEPDEALAREMVAKAKAIVAQTKYDPFLQSLELSKIKMEYLKRQYGREIKADK